jgi:light-regulated signal transduction histidine kinase (bacteriophytochrome)
VASTPRPAVDLTNCALEPIHIPGSIQPHGALVAFTLDGIAATQSENAPELLGHTPLPGEPIAEHHFTPSIRARLQESLGTRRADTFEVHLPDDAVADLSVHVHDELLLAEVEPRGPGARPASEFAMLAQRALERVQQQRDLDSLLTASVEEIALLSGFDRVMAYRFRPDDSGEIVAERMQKPLESFLGLCYPASDIPPQARALFVKNPVRLIADVGYRPAALRPDRNPVTGHPVDLSYASLRGVSPIHVEYLTNMGVRASMSVSMVSQGRLWGMFACHHYAPRLASPAVRMTCRLLSQVVSMMVERFLATEQAQAQAVASRQRLQILERVKADNDMVRALSIGSPSIVEVVPSAGAAVALLGQIAMLGDTPAREDIAAVLDWLDARGAPAQFATHHVRGDAPELDAACAGFPGFAAARYSAEPGAYVVWFRHEQVETVRWAGDPDKPVVVGPHGARLSPRGSFSEWQQVVRDRSEPWSADELYVLEELRRALMDISAFRLQETVRTRELLLAMLGHDLRNPLQAIAMAGEVLRLDESRVEQVRTQIASISGRMGRLINHILDLSRLQAGTGLVRARRSLDIEHLLREVVTESRTAHPEIEIVEHCAGVGAAEVDADRMMQVISNLVSNARHHGTPGKPITLAAERSGATIIVRVTNHGPAITEQALQTLFEPFKRGSLDNPGNPRGLGLGLYIASSIVREHDGELKVESGDGLVTFTITLPCGTM